MPPIGSANIDETAANFADPNAATQAMATILTQVKADLLNQGNAPGAAYIQQILDAPADKLTDAQLRTIISGTLPALGRPVLQRLISLLLTYAPTQLQASANVVLSRDLLIQEI